MIIERSEFVSESKLDLALAIDKIRCRAYSPAAAEMYNVQSVHQDIITVFEEMLASIQCEYIMVRP